MARKILTGLTASPGTVLGQAFLYTNKMSDEPPVSVGEKQEECARVKSAVDASIKELEKLLSQVKSDMGDDYAHIFRSQLTMISDEAILEELLTAVEQGKEKSAEAALREVFDDYLALFEDLGEDDYNKTRSADVKDVYKRVYRNLKGWAEQSLEDMPAGAIVVADDLFPSDTTRFNPERIGAIVTEKGGVTSHVAILAKNLGIPAAVGVAGLCSSIKTDDVLILEDKGTDRAEVKISPDEKEKEQAASLIQKRRTDEKELARYKGISLIEFDRREIVLSANTGSGLEIRRAVDLGAVNVGLFRSEFLFMESESLPDEETQYAVYRKTAESFPEGFVIIRTLDIGGDKQSENIALPVEANPFLGCRGIRLVLEKPDIFRAQLRAILRAGVHGNVKLMFPMVSGLPELEASLDILQECKEELTRDGKSFDTEMEVGVMIEVPSAVMLAGELASCVDFFSIGTNDLTQYLYSADRLNESVSGYYRKYGPALFRAISYVVKEAGGKNCPVGICGELGGDLKAIPLLIGLGITELSMSSATLTQAAKLIQTLDREEVRLLADKALAAPTQKEIEQLLDNHKKDKDKEI